MSAPEPQTIAQALSWAGQIDSETARLDVELLLCHCLDKERSYLFTWPERVLTQPQQLQFQTLFQRRKRGEPVAHILGRRDFWDLNLRVNASTLIPRPDTELLVELGLRLLEREDARVLDLGTGTGAIALSLAKEHQHWQLDAVDSSAAAVLLAQQNAQDNQLANVRIYQSDWFTSIAPIAFDLILSNPPYIDPEDPHLQQGDVRFEPRSALVAGDKGLADIKIIAAQAPEYLTVGGYLMLEHGYDQADQVGAVLRRQGFTEVASFQDLGGNDRVTLGRWYP